VYQASRVVDSSDQALVDLLQLIERFLSHLAIYTQIPHTAALGEMVVKITTELLSTIALATKGLKLGQSSASILVHVLLYSMKRSEIDEETFGREGRRGNTGQTEPTHTR